MSQPCPHCKENHISWKQKYQAAKWAIIDCPACNKRSCSQPFVLVVYTMLYVWDVLLFGYLYYLTQTTAYLIALIAGWLLLDIFSLYLPLSPLKAKSGKTSADETNSGKNENIDPADTQSAKP